MITLPPPAHLTGLTAFIQQIAMEHAPAVLDLNQGVWMDGIALAASVQPYRLVRTDIADSNVALQDDPGVYPDVAPILRAAVKFVAGPAPSVVPEPDTWMLIVAAMAAIGWRLRRLNR